MIKMIYHKRSWVNFSMEINLYRYKNSIQYSPKSAFNQINIIKRKLNLGNKIYHIEIQKMNKPQDSKYYYEIRALEETSQKQYKLFLK